LLSTVVHLRHEWLRACYSTGSSIRALLLALQSWYMLSYSDAAYVCFESYLGFLLLYVLVIPAALYHFSSGRHWHRRVDYDGVSHIPVCSACSSLLSIQSWPSSIPPAPSTALPTALPTALSTALPPLLHSTALIRSNRSSYRSYRRSIYINRCLYTFLNVLSLLHLTVRIGITTTGIASIILATFTVHRSPFSSFLTRIL
jgi:hypothetical protein